jgi:phospholipase C
MSQIGARPRRQHIELASAAVEICSALIVLTLAQKSAAPLMQRNVVKLECVLVRVCLLGAVLLHPGSLKLRGGTLQDVKHVVILMEENRSFDSYYGTMQGVRGFNDPNILLFQNGASDLFQPNGGTNFILPFPLTNSCNYNSMGYRSRGNLSFYYALADAYTICDDNFCSFPGTTFPNRIYLFTGMVDPYGTGGGPAVDNYHVPTNGYSWTTYPERLQAAGVSWRVYRPAGDWFGDALQWFTQYMNATPGNPLYDRGMATVSDVVAAFKADVTNGTLPQVSWIMPESLTYSEHAPYAVDAGEWYVNQIFSALAANPEVFNSTVLILNYDEEGGYFDHLPPPSAPPGTAGEIVSGRRFGLGTRVPMILVSPWTRGGRVCSQVFDHTSVLRFLETWTGVQEPNISAWRRQTCGDLTSAFDFANPDFSIPNLPPAPFTNSVGVAQPPPAAQWLPVQEPGVRPACPLPYQPDASCHADCGSNCLFVTMTNAGAASVHFAIYANAGRAAGPRQYDAAPGATTGDVFVQPVSANGGYDFTCYGPNGFQRRFAGNLNWDCNQIEVASLIDPTAGGITLALLNPGATPVNFTITDNLNAGSQTNFNLLPASSFSQTFSVLTNNNGWYDLTVTADADTNFLRHLAGHVENGAFSFTEPPAIVGNVFLAPTNPPAVLTNEIVLSHTNPVISSIYDIVNQLIAQNPLAATETNSLALTIGAYGTNCALIYPGWASACMIEFSTNLTPPVWQPLSATPTVISNFEVIILPDTDAGEWFRLRR